MRCRLAENTEWLKKFSNFKIKVTKEMLVRAVPLSSCLPKLIASDPKSSAKCLCQE